MDIEGVGREVAGWVLGLDIGLDDLDAAVASLTGLEMVRWRATLLYQFTLAVVTAGKYENCSGATDDAQSRLFLEAFRHIGPELMKLSNTKPRGLASLLKGNASLTSKSVLAEVKATDSELRTALLDGMKSFEAKGELPSVPTWTMRSSDPPICAVSRAVDLTLCRKLGFTRGTTLSAYAHLQLVAICRDAL